MAFWYFLVAALVSTIFIFIRKKFSYWKERSVPHLQPIFPLGNLNQLKSFSMLEKINEIYTKFKGTSPIAGIFFFTRPAVIVLDLELIKSILIKDFPVFTDRMLFTNPEHDPLSDNLFNRAGSKWRTMRTKVTPTFTSAKMKFMFPTVVRVANVFKAAMMVELENSNIVEIRELLARYTVDVIGTCVFGIQCNSLKNPDAEFCRYGRSVFEKPHNPRMLRLFLTTFNELAQKLGFITHDPKFTNFFIKVIRDTVAQREANNIKRNDFMDLLIDLKNQKGPDGMGGLTMLELAAQAFVFFVAGFETSASNMAFGLFELARHPELQDKAREEIIRVLEKHNNELTYESMSEMTYLTQCVTETIRKYPALVSLTRMANENYPIPGTKLVIEKNTPILIPAWSIHYDPEIYPNPTKYDPDRFSSDNVNARNPLAFLGFGDGPRNCVGLRFARMQVRIALITLLKSFRFSVSDETPKEVALHPESFVLLPKDGIRLKVEAI